MALVFDLKKIEAAVGHCDFIGNIDNVYRTKDVIITQVIEPHEIDGEMNVFSYDTFYPRTKRRDNQYNVIFAKRGDNINGRRIKSTITTRHIVY